ncbi:ABC-2 type transport system ATP-binding protein [Enterococcus sp. DIV0212c]|uniref:ABC transporter ATP-binding protein n=1 Tax=Enterococcus sp. DIV0212c TaxID=2230867 RepID=UPI001A9BAC89|nr:ABC transporter ATP-binding protein [Enterococcus sp. DIV0212c]MBO1353222.1 ABC transporter ATP-binding protein [Enterococcus sp. DIV0212c]
MADLVKVEQLSYRKGMKQIFNELSFSVSTGKIIALIGENGSGKTTIMRLLAGLALNWKGQILIDGSVVGTKTKSFVAYLEDQNNFQPNQQLEEVISFYARFYSDFDKRRAYELLRFMNLSESEKLGNLSKGNAEKFALSMTLARRAKLYLLDEPLSGVDLLSREKIIQSLLQWFDEESTIIITTHQLREIETIIDEVLFLRDGQIILHESLETIKEVKHKDLEDLYREVYEI